MESRAGGWKDHVCLGNGSRRQTKRWGRGPGLVCSGKIPPRKISSRRCNNVTVLLQEGPVHRGTGFLLRAAASFNRTTGCSPGHRLPRHPSLLVEAPFKLLVSLEPHFPRRESRSVPISFSPERSAPRAGVRDPPTL